MKKKVFLVFFMLLFFLASVGISVFVCIKLFSYLKYDEFKEEEAVSDYLDLFASEGEFDSYTSSLEKKLKRNYEDQGNFGDGDAVMQFEAAEPSSPGEETITNVQEQGVDEGDIVKAYGDFLIVLRRGKLFSIDTANTGIKPTFQTNAYPKGFTQGGWYDEMLIHSDTLVVIGYSYKLQATEINLFDLNDEGEIKHKESFYIDSNDYYSSRNYATRLVDGKLVLYMPYYLFIWDYDYEDSDVSVRSSLPQKRKWIKGNELSQGKLLLNKTDIYKPVQQITNPTLHTVVSCELEGSISCNAKAVLGPYSRNFYVAPENIYLWISEKNNRYYLQEEDESSGEKNNISYSYVYQLKIKDLTARALKADGTPIDQFSFKESDGFLNVVVREDASGDAMWNPENTTGELALFRTRLENFTDRAKEVSTHDFSSLETPKGYTLQNKFVGDFLLYGTGSNWSYSQNSEDNLFVKEYVTDAEVQKIDLSHSIDRIEAIGDNAVIVGGSKSDLYLSTIELSSSTKVVDVFQIENALQGESRSHGFFYKKYERSGVLGLPVRGSGGNYYDELTDQSAQIVFLKVENDKYLTNLGSLKASSNERINDNCTASCVDWYGNSRPVFYKQRIFALMGYELVEGEVVKEKISEINREVFFKNI